MPPEIGGSLFETVFVRKAPLQAWSGAFLRPSTFSDQFWTVALTVKTGVNSRLNSSISLRVWLIFALAM